MAPPHEPDPFFLEALQRIKCEPGAHALDLACGRGRHALELARRGLLVEAWDRNPEVLAELNERAQREELAVTTREVDCEAPPAAGPFDLVIVFNYLDRSLAERIEPSVRAETWLVVSTFTLDRTGDHPSDRWCLEPGELARGFRGWQVEHSVEADGRAGLIARRSHI